MVMTTLTKTRMLRLWKKGSVISKTAALPDPPPCPSTREGSIMFC